MNIEISKGSLKFLKSRKFDGLIVHGDTLTAVAASLTSHLLGIPVVHVEAGLRSHNLQHPWPEEVNRRIIDMVSTFHFAPTHGAAENLLYELSNSKNIHVVGNTVVDAFLKSSKREKSRNWESIRKLNIELPENFVLLTHHRRESFGEPIRNVFKAIDSITKKYGVEVVFPMHPNPNVRKAYEEVLLGNSSVHVIPPVDYGSMVGLINLCDLVISDSGGIQEEAPYAGKFTLITRETSERMEVVDGKFGALVGTDPGIIEETFNIWLSGNFTFNSEDVNLFGAGDASKKIARILADSL
jgi:UDP-N-acetylglucosamine 2-epimerase